MSERGRTDRAGRTSSRTVSRPVGGLRRRFNSAEAVADVLRERILSGVAPDTELLSTQEELMVEFDVSKAAIREACRILETEGLLNIRRGNVGGASVHVPTPINVAYSLGLVLHARAVDLGDVRSTLGRLEPLCAGLCAGRSDRETTVMPALRDAHARMSQRLDAGDGSGAAIAARDWHEALVRHCGLETMAVVAGAVEEVWTSHVRAGLSDTRERGLAPDPSMSRSVLDDHARINRLIEAGDVAAATAAAAEHLDNEPRIHADGGDLTGLDVRAQVVRDQLFKR